ncbi:MAG: superoxide dismutase, Ni [Desulfotalea sp.]
MKKNAFNALIIFCTFIGLSLITPSTGYTHCQIPCGIYNDSARVEMMLEDAQTVEKATKLIADLAGKTDAQSVNQATRWVNNKEIHAQKIIATISDYFLTQRVKASQKDYTERLVKHHTVIVAAMKVKQNVDPKYVQALKEAIMSLETYYHND